MYGVRYTTVGLGTYSLGIDQYISVGLGLSKNTR